MPTQEQTGLGGGGGVGDVGRRFVVAWCPPSLPPCIGYFTPSFWILAPACDGGLFSGSLVRPAPSILEKYLHAGETENKTGTYGCRFLSILWQQEPDSLTHIHIHTYGTYLRQHEPPLLALGRKSAKSLFICKVRPEGGLEMGLRLGHLCGERGQRPVGRSDIVHTK